MTLMEITVERVRVFCHRYPGGALALAAYTGCNTESTVYNWIKRGRIPKARISKVQEFIDAEGITLRVFISEDRTGVKWELKK